MSLCISGAEPLRLAVTAFTLAWTHSVERIGWEEDWQVTPAGLQIVEARVRGSGAGMEPPDGAKLIEGWWRYVPLVPPLRELELAASGATVGGWSLCAEGRCITLGAAPGGPVRLLPCADADGPQPAPR